MAKLYAAWTPMHDKRYLRVKNFKSSEDYMWLRTTLLSSPGELYKDEHFSEYLEEGKQWKRAKDIATDPKFINVYPTRFDVLQGDLNDCWLIAGIEAITVNHSLINYVVPPDQNFTNYYFGAFHFRIWQLGMWNDVVVDDRLPVWKKDGSLCNAHADGTGDVFWGALLEKAYAKVLSKSIATYEILNHGFVINSLQDFSGGIVQRILIKKPPEGKTIKGLLTEVQDRWDLMCVSTPPIEDSREGILPNHSYAITKVFQFRKEDYDELVLVRIMNPWGKKEWTGEWSDDDYKSWRQIDRFIRARMEVDMRPDGEFWMQVSDITDNFLDLWIVQLEPTQYLDMRGIKKRNAGWYTIDIYGEWVEGENAFGSDPFERNRNPQYMILFEKHKLDKDPSAPCQAVIDLSFRPKVGRDIEAVGFYVYDAKELPLLAIDIKELTPLDEHPKFSWGCYNSAVSFKPGYFMIIPCTLTANTTGEFLLRVFSECPVKLAGESRNYRKKRSVTQLQDI